MTRARRHNHQRNCEALESRQLLSTGPVTDLPEPTAPLTDNGIRR